MGVSEQKSPCCLDCVPLRGSRGESVSLPFAGERPPAFLDSWPRVSSSKPATGGRALSRPGTLLSPVLFPNNLTSQSQLAHNPHSLHNLNFPLTGKVTEPQDLGIRTWPSLGGLHSASHWRLSVTLRSKTELEGRNATLGIENVL